MTTSILPHRLLSQRIGCEVEFDLNREPSAAELEYLRRLYTKHYLLLFRGQSLTMDRQVAVADYFGPVLRTPDGTAYVSNVRPDGVLGEDELNFHSDLAYAEYPSLSVSLHAIDVVNDATSTHFVSSVGAYPCLPEELKRRIEGLRTLHVSANRRKSVRPENIAYGPDHPQFIHPLVLIHPTTGERILYVMENQTVRVMDMPDDESEALLQDLFSYIYTPENSFEHKWRLGDLLIWDNLALQHARNDIKGHGNRTLQRTSAGKKGLYEQYPQLDRLYNTLFSNLNNNE